MRDWTDLALYHTRGFLVCAATSLAARALGFSTFVSLAFGACAVVVVSLALPRKV
jgi:hypothetical protein